MKRVRNRIAAALLAGLLLTVTALPVSADFNQETLNGIVMITTLSIQYCMLEDSR